MSRFKFNIKGIDEVIKTLDKVAPKHAKALMRSTVQGVATEAAAEIRKAAPVGESRNLRKSIKAKRKKSHPLRPRSEIYVVRGKSRSGGGGWYWHFVEHGTVKQRAQPFIAPVMRKYNKNIRKIFTERFIKQLEKKLKSEAKKAKK